MLNLTVLLTAWKFSVIKVFVIKAVTVTSLIPTTTYHMTTIQSKPQPITPEKTQETEPSITKTATSHTAAPPCWRSALTC